MKIISVGHVSYDTILTADKYPIEGSFNKYKEKTECVGGSAAIAAILFGRWNDEALISGVVGNDGYGVRIKKELTLNRVGVKYLDLNDEATTSTSLIIANRENGKRTIFNYNSKNVSLSSGVITDLYDGIIFDGTEVIASVDLLNRYPGAISVITPSYFSKDVMDLCNMCKYMICSLENAERFTGIKYDADDKKTLVDIYNKIDGAFTTNVIINLGDMGCLYKSDDIIKLMPTIKVKTIDNNGADEIFAGAFIYSLVHGFDTEKTMKFANIARSLSLTRVGGYNSIPTIDEMNDLYDKVK